MQDLILTKNFVDKWQERVGNWPTPEAVRAYLSQSVKVQQCQNLMRLDGSPFRMLAIFWHPELDLVIKVDTDEHVAVTVHAWDRYIKRTLDVGRPLRSDVGREEEFVVQRPTAHVPRDVPSPHFPQSLMARIARVRERFGLKRLIHGAEA